MDQSLRRSDERYFADIRAVLETFYRPGDILSLTRRFLEAFKCQMCGGKVDIRNCFELQNDRTKQRIVCGRNCIVKYATVVEQMNQRPVIKFPDMYRADAAKINELRPNTVTVLPLSSFPDFTDDREDDEDDMDLEDMDHREYDELDLAPEEGYEALSEIDDWDEDGAEREH